MTNKTFFGTAAGTALAVCLNLAAPTPAQAAFTFNIAQQGANVVVSGSGTLNLAGLAPGTGGNGDVAFLNGPGAELWQAVGPYATFAGLSGPGNFGDSDGNIYLASTFSGDTVGLQLGATLIVPAGYVSGMPLSANMVFENHVFVGLSIHPGTYVWTWSSDTLTVHVDALPGALIPEPTTALLLGAGLLGLAARQARKPT